MILTIEVTDATPAELVDLADAMTGHDDDVILAAETAIRDRMDAAPLSIRVELGPDLDRIVRAVRSLLSTSTPQEGRP